MLFKRIGCGLSNMFSYGLGLNYISLVLNGIKPILDLLLRTVEHYWISD